MLNKTMHKPDKWRPRRKLLTPTFHYEILKDFVEVYNRHGRTLLGKFLKHADGGQYEDIFHTVTLCTLDVICEAALGICLDVQKNPHSPYLESVFKMKVIIQKRLVKPQYYPEFLFNLIGAGRGASAMCENSARIHWKCELQVCRTFFMSSFKKNLKLGLS
ncbi:hypothetical protein COOONC_19191 [Cooperia oncophora]